MKLITLPKLNVSIHKTSLKFISVIIKCFGVSVTWWDDICKTMPSKAANISSRIIHFYFSDEVKIATKRI